MGQSYVSDIIGEDYKNWKPGDRILISTGTGSGKTWFVLRVLLGEAKRQGKHLVYFCNRKFLSLQVQAKAKSILLNELGQDEEGLAEYLHVRTYQRAEKAFDYPNIREICEDGSTGQNTEVQGKDVLYYVFDEAFYFVMDAGFNLDTHHWYDRADITANQQSVSVFLAATPEPLLMYLEFKVVKGSSLTELCKRYMARFFLNQGNDVDRWMGFLSPQYRGLMEQRKRASGDYWQTTEIDRQIKGCIEKTKQQSREPALELFEKVEHAYRSEKEREYLLQRQKEGITIAKQEGKYKGRKPLERAGQDTVIASWRSGEITAAEAMRTLKMSKTTFYRRVNQTERRERP